MNARPNCECLTTSRTNVWQIFTSYRISEFDLSKFDQIVNVRRYFERWTSLRRWRLPGFQLLKMFDRIVRASSFTKIMRVRWVMNVEPIRLQTFDRVTEVFPHYKAGQDYEWQLGEVPTNCEHSLKLQAYARFWTFAVITHVRPC